MTLRLLFVKRRNRFSLAFFSAVFLLLPYSLQRSILLFATDDTCFYHYDAMDYGLYDSYWNKLWDSKKSYIRPDNSCNIMLGCAITIDAAKKPFPQ